MEPLRPPGGMEAHSRAMEAHPGAMEVHCGAMEAYCGAMEDSWAEKTLKEDSVAVGGNALEN
jgi:hypothetical protein